MDVCRASEPDILPAALSTALWLEPLTAALPDVPFSPGAFGTYPAQALRPTADAAAPQPDLRLAE
eukprot:CAMPEP_0169436054 /NCGR_PEP_ID=MMETSP1042-20121227/5389_1 /TAXON_ID=464988 /ORGANISM="Hemiselmis andersenii, Strain CCMP1180" /LENGTH=64 /DNA_ID=CAMNT_0009546733 /DNA_START=521 /DNA_END=713 /DNA_ORIENTATION=+